MSISAPRIAEIAVHDTDSCKLKCLYCCTLPNLPAPHASCLLRFPPPAPNVTRHPLSIPGNAADCWQPDSFPYLSCSFAICRASQPRSTLFTADLAFPRYHNCTEGIVSATQRYQHATRLQRQCRGLVRAFLLTALQGCHEVEIAHGKSCHQLGSGPWSSNRQTYLPV